ncbi:hypothetical protein ACE6H2_011224 [Prunus campanulata]
MRAEGQKVDQVAMESRELEPVELDAPITCFRRSAIQHVILIVFVNEEIYCLYNKRRTATTHKLQMSIKRS